MKTVGNNYLLDFYYNDLFVKVEHDGSVSEVSIAADFTKEGYIIVPLEDLQDDVRSSIQFEAAILLKEMMELRYPIKRGGETYD